MKRTAATPDDYLAQVPHRQKPVLEALRTLILEGSPGIAEGLRYGMLDYPGLANLAAQKHYVALYVLPEALAAFKGRFPGVSCGKSCLRFARLEQVDRSAIADLLQAVRRARQSGDAE